MLKGFKAFVLRGNVVDLAVAVVIGAGFGVVIDSLVKDVLTPIISIPGKSNFPDLHIKIRHSIIAYGSFLNALVAFVLLAAAVYFVVVAPLNRLSERRTTEPEAELTSRDCPECLSAIPKQARRCAFCTATVTPQTA